MGGALPYATFTGGSTPPTGLQGYKNVPPSNVNNRPAVKQWQKRHLSAAEHQACFTVSDRGGGKSKYIMYMYTFIFAV